MAVALGVGACSSTPPVRFHTLMPSGSVLAPAAAAAPLAIVLDPVRMPVQVDQPQWLVRLADDSVAVLEQDRWASPLRDELRQALLERLIVGYGVRESRAAASGPEPLYRIGIDVRRFDSLPSREARIVGSWLVAPANGRGPASRCEWSFRETAPGTLLDLAAAHRRAVVRLGDAVGEVLVLLSRGAATPCPAPDGAP